MRVTGTSTGKKTDINEACRELRFIAEADVDTELLAFILRNFVNGTLAVVDLESGLSCVVGVKQPGVGK